MLTEFQTKDLATLMLKNNRVLCPEIFNEDNSLKQAVQEKLLEISTFLIDKISSFMNNFEVEDVYLCGGIASHIYNDYTDIDICIVVKHKKFDDEPSYFKGLLKKINPTISNVINDIRIYGRKIDVGFINVLDRGSGLYSLTQNKWLFEPKFQKFPFTLKDFLTEYAEYTQEIDNYIIGLEKIETGFLTQKSCQKVENYLLLLKEKMFKEKSSSVEKEYGLNHNLYRLFTKSGKHQEIRDYIADSYNQLINFLEERGE
ncbi:MAG: hypothetical protein ACK5N8_00915 [Alphaproteobacteria bacterium]